MTQFPTATILGYPRIGRGRELKKALEAYWAGRISADELRATEAQLRKTTRDRLAQLGLGKDDASIPETFALYDQVLDAITLLGAVPERYRSFEGLDLHFALARGNAQVAPLEMTKWFDTNYHHLVPEIGPDTPISFADHTIVDRFLSAKEEGTIVRPVLVGPVTFLAVAKADEATPDYNPFERLDDVVAAYADVLAKLSEAGAPWVQIDEHALASDNLHVERTTLIEYSTRVFAALAKLEKRPAIFAAIGYGDGAQAAASLASTGIEALGLDLCRGALPEAGSVDLSTIALVAGVVDGRNIWRTDLESAIARLDAVKALNPASLAVSTSTSLQHVPHDTALEKWDDPVLDANLHAWLAFADQKVGEVVTLARGVNNGWDSISEAVEATREVLAQRAAAPGVVRPELRERVARLTEADREREDFAVRDELQRERLGLPLIPTTTIGSFPQTKEIRRARAAWAKGELSDEDYAQRMREEIESVIRLQENLGLDVLVHGEAERNDMVQYFAEQLEGFAATKNGWVQSYGSRCTRPSILWGDVVRPHAMTVEWARYAQSLTDHPVKGMLTGPVTIIAWSFPRNDLPLAEVADQIGLALRDEVTDLQDAGIAVVQVDEPALRELLPLDQARHADYLKWAVDSFRLATAGVRPDTQIHTHLCYSEFGQILDAILGLDADVTSIEAARSRMEVLPELAEQGFSHGVGPGVWDIHSPRVPSVEELTELLTLAADSIELRNLWSNPDCGLKTRGYAETEESLKNLVEATRIVRQQLAN